MMICQHCKKRPATTYFSETVNGHQQELYLCEVCAAQHQVFDVADLLQGFWTPVSSSSVERCESCGMSESEFLKSGKFGCAACARTFAARTHDVLKQIHGRSKHTGKVPAHGQEQLQQERELERLQKSLQEAITAERYEEAAQLRDAIRDLKGGEMGCGTTK